MQEDQTLKKAIDEWDRVSQDPEVLLAYEARRKTLLDELSALRRAEKQYVFDHGYLDYERFDRMTDDGYFFLSRLRKNAVIREVYNFKLPENTAVLSDQMVLIGTTKNRAENYFRLLKVMDSKGNDLHLTILYKVQSDMEIKLVVPFIILVSAKEIDQLLFDLFNKWNLMVML